MTHEARHQGFEGVTATSAPPIAATADVLRCYEEAVQEPMVECMNLDGLYTNAQAPHSDRIDALVLREDFSSTAIIAKTWLTLRPQNRSQAVDIDLEALRDTQNILGGRRARLLQSPSFANAPHTVELMPASMEPKDARGETTWDVHEGQATTRLDRRLAKRSPAHEAPEPRITLLHSNVLELPMSPPVGEPPLEAPDMVASLNYAMAYFHDRATLKQYLTGVLHSLRPKTGVFITDMFGLSLIHI